MTSIEARPLVLPPDLSSIYDRAKTEYMSAKYQAALDSNTTLFQQAETIHHSLGQIIGKRFMGLCHYRLGKLEASKSCFEAAIRLADDAHEIEQKLLLFNHLAATLRRLGKLEDAYSTLKRALEMAPMTDFIHAHARLLGNLGALLDEFGQRSAADDCYARFEVLSRLLGNEHRLANAVGLAARSAELRGDIETAEAKYAEEARLAVKVGDPLRQIAATLHRARVATHRGNLDEAESGYVEAVSEAKRVSHEKRYTDSLEEYGNFLRKFRRNLPAAHRNLMEAMRICNEPEKQANVNHGLALVCRDAGLYGESLHYLMQSVAGRVKLYEQLRAAKDLTKGRLNDLKEITSELVDDAFQVARTPDIQDRLRELVDRVNDAPGAWDAYRLAAAEQTRETIWKRHRELERRSRETWGTYLLPNHFTKLFPQSQSLLERAERSYSSTVDDLGRSAHLLALVVECELKARVFERVASKQRWTLGEMLSKLNIVAAQTRAPKATDPLYKVYHYTRKYRPLIEQICKATGPIPPADGSTPLVLVDIRNGVAHGDEATLTSLGRLQIDAIKRRLALEAPQDGLTVFQALAQLPVLP